MPFGVVATVLTAAARTTSSTSPAGTAEIGGTLDIELVVTAVSGTAPTLNVAVQWSEDGVNFGAADPPDAFTQITAATNVVKQFLAKAQFYRLSYTIGGTTPSFTFSAIATVNP